MIEADQDEIDPSDQSDLQASGEDLGAVNDEIANGDPDEGEKPKAEVHSGMTIDDLGKVLKDIPSSQAEKIEALPKKTTIQIVRLKNGEVSKVIPTRIIRTDYAGGTTSATLTDGEDRHKIRIVKDPGVVYLKKGRRSSTYYYIDDQGVDNREAKVNFVHSNRGQAK